jgi:2-dehydro-3-deoxyphosphooctonate aldolase (KDO 8-P synthase)
VFCHTDRGNGNISNQGKMAELIVIAGPCVVETVDMTMTIAYRLNAVCTELGVPLIFKASFRKANRSRIGAFTGIGDTAALRILDGVRKEFRIPVTTDVHSVADVALVTPFVDIIQIPAFLGRQTDILIAAGATGKMVNIKKGQFMTAEQMEYAIEKIQYTGSEKIMLTERGNSFGYADLIIDMRNIPLMRRYNVPVIVDITHPNMNTPAMTETLGCSAVAAGADGVFIETHPYPLTSKSDGNSMLPLNKIKSLIEKLLKIKEAIK